MKYAVECFALGFICESLIESDSRADVLDRTLEHLDQTHSVGVNSSGFKDFIGRHIKQVDDTVEPAPPARSRRGPRGHGDLAAWISDRFRPRANQATHDEERTP